MTRLIAFAAIALTVLTASNSVLAADCRAPGRFGPGSEAIVPPLVRFADEILREDIAAARAMTDPIAAIARLQTNQFAMRHPRIAADNYLGWYRARCGKVWLYVELDSAIAARVQALREGYRERQQVLGDPEQRFQTNRSATEGSGLLDLLLAANLYDDFEAEAAAFLRRAIGDAQARQHFKTVTALATHRLQYLQELREAYGADYTVSITGLLPTETEAFTALPDLAARLDPIRAEHVRYWLNREAESFAVLLKNVPPPNALVTLPFDLGTATGQLELALQIAQPTDEAGVRALAERRGDELGGRGRHAEAAEYYDLAGADTKALQSRQLVERSLQNRASELAKTVDPTLDALRKSPAERESFESETDALAEELGVDLESF